MRIMLVTSQFPPDSFGGVETITFNIATYFKSQGHKVAILSGRVTSKTEQHGGWQRDIFQDIPIYRVFVHFESRQLFPDKQVLDQDMAPAIQQILRDFEPDVVQVLQVDLLTFTVFRTIQDAGIPVTYSALNYGAICFNNSLIQRDGSLCDGQAGFKKCLDCQRHYTHPANLVVKLLNRLDGANWARLNALAKKYSPRRIGVLMLGQTQYLRLQNLAYLADRLSAVIAPSNWVRRIFILNGFAEKQVRLIRNGIITHPSKNKKQSGHKKILHIGFAGRLHPTKGIDVLIRAFRQLPADAPIQLDIYGDAGPYEKDYKFQLESMSGGDTHIRFFEPYTASERNQVFERLDLLVIPSIWYENYPIIVLEAADNHLPVIASDLGGLSEVVSLHNAGWLFPPGDVEALRIILENILSDRSSLDQVCQRIVQPRNVSDEAKDLLALYQELIASV